MISPPQSICVKLRGSSAESAEQISLTHMPPGGGNISAYKMHNFCNYSLATKAGFLQYSTPSFA
jgi:hypothetical protein